MSKKVIIIGGGMAGLSAGTYLSMNGYDTTIFEMHSAPGGVCTSWKKGDFTIDFCVHWLVGSGRSSSFYERWNELLELETINFIDHDLYAAVDDEKGRRFSIWTDVDRLEKEMMSISSEDEPRIKEFTGAIRKLTGLDFPTDKAEDLANFWDQLKQGYLMLPYLGILRKFIKVSCEDYAKKFKDPLLRKAIANLFEPETPVVFSMMTLAWMHIKAAGYPIGGSLQFANKIYATYRHLGGEANFNNKVVRILVENDKAIGVELANGDTHYADFVVSAADGYYTLFKMLEGKYLDKKFSDFYSDKETFPSIVFLAFGLNKDLSDQPHSMLFPLNHPLAIDPGTRLNDLWVRVHNFDPTLAPEGKTLVTIIIETKNYHFWQDLMEMDPAKYEFEKNRILEAVADILDEKLGDFKTNIEMTDVSTPATLIHFTNNWKGSFEGWQITTDTGFSKLPNTLKGLSNFYMCGHWVAIGGGLPMVMLSGRDVAQMICKQDGKTFDVRETEEIEG